MRKNMSPPLACPLFTQAKNVVTPSQRSAAKTNRPGLAGGRFDPHAAPQEAGQPRSPGHFPGQPGPEDVANDGTIKAEATPFNPVNSLTQV